MQSDPQSSRDGILASSDRGTTARAELEQLRTTCRKQARDIAELTKMLNAMHALTATHAEPRADELEQHSDPALGRWEIHLALDAYAPAAARKIVSDLLADRVPASVLHDALLLVSELASNSVRHSGVGADGELVLRMRLRSAAVRIDVQDPGISGMLALREPAPDGAGLGLHILQALSQAWGIERDCRAGTRVWTQIAIPTIRSPLLPLL